MGFHIYPIQHMPTQGTRFFNETNRNIQLRSMGG